MNKRNHHLLSLSALQMRGKRRPSTGVYILYVGMCLYSVDICAVYDEVFARTVAHMRIELALYADNDDMWGECHTFNMFFTHTSASPLCSSVTERFKLSSTEQTCDYDYSSTPNHITFYMNMFSDRPKPRESLPHNGTTAPNYCTHIL